MGQLNVGEDEYAPTAYNVIGHALLREMRSKTCTNCGGLMTGYPVNEAFCTPGCKQRWWASYGLTTKGKPIKIVQGELFDGTEQGVQPAR